MPCSLFSIVFAAKLLYVLVFTIFAAGISVTFVLHHYLSEKDNWAIEAHAHGGLDEALFLTSQSFASLTTFMSIVATTNGVMSPSNWTREAAATMSNQTAGKIGSLAWWESLPVAEAGALTSRLETLRVEYGFPRNYTDLSPRILTAQGVKPLSQFYPTPTTEVTCGPITAIEVQGDMYCIPKPPSAASCTQSNSCITPLMYLSSIPVDVFGEDVFTYGNLLLDLSRVESRERVIARAISMGKPVASEPVALVSSGAPSIGVSIWSPVFRYTEVCVASTCYTPIRGLLATTVQATWLKAELESSQQLAHLWWAVYDTETSLVLASSHPLSDSSPYVLAHLLEKHTFVEFGEGGVTELAREVTALGRTWRIAVRVREKDASRYRTEVPILALIFGLFLSLAIPGMLLLLACAQRMRSRSRVKQLQSQHDAELRVHDTVLGYIHHELRSPLHVLTGCIDEASYCIRPRPADSSTSGSGFDHGLVGQDSLPNSFTASTEDDVAELTLEPYLASPSATHAHAERIALRFLRGARDAVVTMTRHVDDMLDFAKLRRGEFVAVHSPVNVLRLVRRTVHHLRSFAQVPVRCDTRKYEEQAAQIGNPSLVRCVTDPGRLEQLVTNGLTNAIKHTYTGYILVSIHLELSRSKPLRTLQEDATQQAGAVLTDSAAFQPVSLPQNNTHYTLIIKVTDTGEGLQGTPPELLFKPFVSYDRAAKQSSKLHSTGLGLPLCQTLANRLGGRISLKDTGAGCEFSIALPVAVMLPSSVASNSASPTPASTTLAERNLADKHHSAAAPAVSGEEIPQLSTTATAAVSISAVRVTNPYPDSSATAVPGAEQSTKDAVRLTSRILVVDDVPMNVKLASNMIRRLGGRVTGLKTPPFESQVISALRATGQMVVPNNSEAKSEDFEDRYDAIFLDIRLGNENGVHLFSNLKRLWAVQPPVEIPKVVAMTASATLEDIKIYRDKGFHGLLSKPFKIDRVKATLDHIYGGDGWKELT